MASKHSQKCSFSFNCSFQCRWDCANLHMCAHQTLQASASLQPSIHLPDHKHQMFPALQNKITPPPPPPPLFVINFRGFLRVFNGTILHPYVSHITQWGTLEDISGIALGENKKQPYLSLSHRKQEQTLASITAPDGK